MNELDYRDDANAYVGNCTCMSPAWTRLGLALRRINPMVRVIKPLSTVTSLANLAHVHHDLWQHRDAGRLAKEALQIREEILGERHPDTISVSWRLAMIYSALGRHDEAERLSSKAVNLMKEILGRRHPE